jgi:hypothetical protein
MHRKLFTGVGYLILLIGCAPKASNPLQQPEYFAEVYAKILIATVVDADSILAARTHTTARSAVADSVLRSLGLEWRQFETAVKYFSENPKHWQEVYTNVVKILEDEHGRYERTRTNTDDMDGH